MRDGTGLHAHGMLNRVRGMNVHSARCQASHYYLLLCNRCHPGQGSRQLRSMLRRKGQRRK